MNTNFDRFISTIPAHDYVFENNDYEELISAAAEFINEADFVLIGAGAGLSTAAGIEYGGSFFRENFREFIERYGENEYMTDSYSAGFYPFPDEKAKWGYWSRHALKTGIEIPAKELYITLHEMVKDKNHFVLTTNVDEQFTKAGFTNLFETQGRYSRIQCRRACHDKVYDATEMFYQMDQARKNAEVPYYMVPKCPVCGGVMEMQLRVADYPFVEGEEWKRQDEAFGRFLEESKKGRLVLMDLGTGFNTPIIIRFPFEKLVRERKNASLIRLNLNEAVVQRKYIDRSIGINEDMAKSINDISSVLRKLEDKE